jgi:hypothetical protein
MDNNLTNDHYCITIKDNSIYWCGNEKCENKLNDYIIGQQFINNIILDFSSIQNKQYKLFNNSFDIQKQFIDLQGKKISDLEKKISDLEKKYYEIKNEINKINNINIYMAFAILFLLLSIVFENHNKIK